MPIIIIMPIIILGPLVYQEVKRDHEGKAIKMHYVVGIVSIGKRCATKGSPRFYARVTGALAWIHQVVGLGNKEVVRGGKLMKLEPNVTTGFF